MDGIAKWWEKLTLQLKLQILIQGFLIVILTCAQQWISAQFERQALSAAQERSKTVADGAINGLNTLMITKIGKDDVISNKESRALFIQKMGASEGIKEMRVIRAKGIEDEYGSGLPQERVMDDIDRIVLSSGKTESKITIDSNEASLRTVVPFIASKNFRTTNCLKCHGVEEGATLGAASVTLDIKDDISNIKRVNTLIWIGQIVLQIILFFVIGRIVSRLLRQLGGEPAYVIDIAKQIDNGNLAGEILTRTGDNSSMLVAMKHMQGSLKDIIGGALQSADKLTQDAQQVATSSRQVLKSSELQSEATESMAAAFEEMVTSMSAVAENADHAKQISRNGMEHTKNGNESLSELIGVISMVESSVDEFASSVSEFIHSTEAITNMTQQVKDIAKQTNLLALNAAIEAARAGEQGRGFAVVADEVRKLAEKSAESARQIDKVTITLGSQSSAVADAIQNSQKLLQASMDHLENVAVALSDTNQAVSQSTESMDNIAQSVNEQKMASHEIAQNVEKIAQMTEANRSSIQKNAEATDHMERQVSVLRNLVSHFKI